MLLANTDQRGIRKHTVTPSFGLGSVSVKFVMTGLFAALALLYLAQSAQGQTRAYEVRSLDNQRQGLEDQHQRLEVEATRLKSLQEIQKNFSTEPGEDGQAANWEKVTNVSYVSNVTPAPTP